VSKLTATAPAEAAEEAVPGPRRVDGRYVHELLGQRFYVSDPRGVDLAGPYKTQSDGYAWLAEHEPRPEDMILDDGRDLQAVVSELDEIRDGLSDYRARLIAHYQDARPARQETHRAMIAHFHTWMTFPETKDGPL
jgi:hypothetical protein